MNNKKNLFSIVFILVIFLFACEKNHKLPGYQVNMLTDMVESVPYDGYSSNPVYKNGVTLQKPVEGTIPRGYVPFHYTLKDAELAGRELLNPIKATKQNLERGQFMYDTFCLQCHGKTGDGDGQLIPKYPNPPSFLSDKFAKMPDGQIYHSITLGKRDMPSHASQIESVDRWKIILYVRELQKSAGLKIENVISQ